VKLWPEKSWSLGTVLPPGARRGGSEQDPPPARLQIFQQLGAEPADQRRVASDPQERICRLTAEFSDDALELRFRNLHLQSDARRLQAAMWLGGAIYPVFGLMDYIRHDGADGSFQLFLLRWLVPIAAGIVALSVRRRPERVLSAWPVTSVETLAFAVFLITAATMPQQMSTRTLQLVVLAFSLFIFVPNRFLQSTSLVAAGVAGYLLVATQLPAVNDRLGVDDVVTIIVVVMVGALTQWMLESGRRNQYLSLLQEQRSRERLEFEVAQRTALQHELQWLADHDALSDLLNRRAFYEAADRTFAEARRADRPVAVLVIDADHFKTVNDRFGHHTGDEAIRLIARQCKLHLRTDDVVGRLGGEEFAIVMPAASGRLAAEVADRLRTCIARAQIEHPDGIVSITVSIGFTEGQPWAETVQEALQRADGAMYSAKASGRDCVVGV